jgi:hypothetical protein
MQSAMGEVRGPDVTPSQIVSGDEVRQVVGNAIVQLQVEHSEEMEAVLVRVFEGQSWDGMKNWMGLSSSKRARTLFARGVFLLRPVVEKALGRAAFLEFFGS